MPIEIIIPGVWISGMLIISFCTGYCGIDEDSAATATILWPFIVPIALIAVCCKRLYSYGTGLRKRIRGSENNG